MSSDPSAELPLQGGNVSGGIVRVGDTVRRPAGPWSPTVHAFLSHLNNVGYDGAPRTLGFDAQGRHVVEYVGGVVAMPFPHDDLHRGLRRVGRLLREFHDAAATFTPPPDATWNVVIEPDRSELIVHHDAAPWNLIVGRERWVFIDWDNAGPGSRLWDLAYAAHGFVPLSPETPVAEAGERLAALADGYRLDESDRQALAELLHRRIMSMYELLERGGREGSEPWCRLWRQGHGDTWRRNADYVDRYATLLTRALVHASL
ncbi:MAG TPA: kinase [Acidimicrobiaceae bacterium]|nr:kinase [Acidimicrobiaceae bacterium]